MFLVFVIGYFVDKIIIIKYENADIIQVFTGFLFYYFTLDLIIRFLNQQLPTLSIQHYITLPIKKRILLHYILIKSVLSFFNIIAILLIVPFFIKVICASKPLSFCLIWIITMVSLVATNNFLNFSLKKYFSKRPLLIMFLLAIVVVFIFLDINGMVSCSVYFSEAILYITNTLLLGVIPIIILILSYLLGYFLLKKNSYIEYTQSSMHSANSRFSIFNRFGEAGSLIGTEIKLILRNSRPKSMLYISIIFLLYGFFFSNENFLINQFILIFIPFIQTYAFAATYGQFLYGWEGSFFDCYMANKVSSFAYIKSKYLLLAITSFIGYILSLPCLFINYEFGFPMTAMLFYNIGISSIILLFIGTYNKLSIDMKQSQFMNYQGITIVNSLFFVIPLGFPISIYFLFNLLGFSQYVFYTLGVIGLIGIMFNQYLIQIVVNQFVKRKYIMTYSFRQK